VTAGIDGRVAPGDRRAVGLVNWLIARVSGRVTGTTPPNLFLVLGRHRRLFRGWLHFAGRMMPGGRLPRRDTELVILRVAHLRDCRYELEHHRRLAARAGLSEEEVARVTDGPDAPGWTDRQRVLLLAVDQMHATGDLDDAAWADLRRHLDERGAIELVMLAGHYEMLATAIAALRIPADRPRRRRG
jgi:AhpD family alkylhydroperoxidase